MKDLPYDLEHDVHRITLYNSVARDHQHRSLRRRLYLHLDMNCFYAQVEQRAYNLYGLPVAMGGWRKENGVARGIVATASYEARQLGVKTAMSAFEASQICPYLVFLQIDYDKYKGISAQLQEILDDFAPQVEKYSMDEYFMDVTFLMSHSREEIRGFVQRLKERVYDTLGLICSVGVAYSKTYSKLASDLRKPNGMMLILDEDDAREHLWPLPLDEIWGIGRRRYVRLQQRGLHTICDAMERGPGTFREIFGEMQGQLFYEMAAGRDKAKVLDQSRHVPQEIGYMHTFSDWTIDVEQVRGEVVKAVRKVCYRMRGYKRQARKFSCHIRFQGDEWKGINLTFNTPGYTNLDDYVLESGLPRILSMLRYYLREGEQIRGIGLQTIDMIPTGQLELFFQEEERVRSLYRATDRINNYYGADTIVQASVKEHVPGKTHFVSR